MLLTAEEVAEEVVAELDMACEVVDATGVTELVGFSEGDELVAGEPVELDEVWTVDEVGSEELVLDVECTEPLP